MIICSTTVTVVPLWDESIFFVITYFYFYFDFFFDIFACIRELKTQVIVHFNVINRRYKDINHYGNRMLHFICQEVGSFLLTLFLVVFSYYFTAYFLHLYNLYDLIIFDVCFFYYTLHLFIYLSFICLLFFYLELLLSYLFFDVFVWFYLFIFLLIPVYFTTHFYPLYVLLTVFIIFRVILPCYGS